MRCFSQNSRADAMGGSSSKTNEKKSSVNVAQRNDDGKRRRTPERPVYIVVNNTPTTEASTSRSTREASTETEKLDLKKERLSQITRRKDQPLVEESTVPRFETNHYQVSSTPNPVTTQRYSIEEPIIRRREPISSINRYEVSTAEIPAATQTYSRSKEELVIPRNVSIPLNNRYEVSSTPNPVTTQTYSIEEPVIRRREPISSINRYEVSSAENPAATQTYVRPKEELVIPRNVSIPLNNHHEVSSTPNPVFTQTYSRPKEELFIPRSESTGIPSGNRYEVSPTPNPVSTQAQNTDKATNSKAAGQQHSKTGRKTSSMSVNYLQTTTENSQPHVLAFILNNHLTGFVDLLNENPLPFATVKLVTTALYKVCACTHVPFTLSALLQTVIYTKYFHQHLPQCLKAIEAAENTFVVNVLGVCNRILAENKQEAVQKLTKVLKNAKIGVSNLEGSNSSVMNDMIEDMLLSLNSPDKITDDISCSELSAVHVMMLENELKKVVRDQRNDGDFAELVVQIQGLHCSAINGIEHRLTVVEKRTVRGRVLITGSIVKLQPQAQPETEEITATITQIKQKDGIIFIKCHKNNNLPAYNTVKYVLIEGPVLYEAEILNLQQILETTSEAEIGFVEQFRPTGMELMELKEAETNDFKFDDVHEGIITVDIGLNDDDVGVKFIKQKLVENPSQPVLFLCRSDFCLDKYLSALIGDGSENEIKLVRVGGICKKSLFRVTLSELRKNSGYEIDIPLTPRRDLTRKLIKLKEQIDNEVQALAASFNTILDTASLNPFMTPAEKKFFLSTPIATWLHLKHGMNIKIVDDGNSQINKFQNNYQNSAVEVLRQTEVNRRVLQFFFNEYKELDAMKNAKLSEISNDDDNKGSMTIYRSHIDSIMTEPDDLCKMMFIHELDANRRWQRYGSWLRKFQKNKIDTINKLGEKYEKLTGQLNEIVDEVNFHLMKKANVIAMTAVAAIKYHRIIKRLEMPTVVVAEASNIPEAHIIPLVSNHSTSCTLFGNKLGIQPSLSGVLVTKRDNHQQVTSIFERVLHSAAPSFTSQLMNPVPINVYKFLKKLNCWPHSVLPTFQPKRLNWDLIFLNHNQANTLTADGEINPYEAQIVSGVCYWLIKKQIRTSQITVVTFQKCQWSVLLGIINPEVSCEMVEHFVGRKNDVIILSLGGELCEEIYSKRFLYNLMSMVNVCLICVANLKKIDDKKNGAIWSQLISCAEDEGIVMGTAGLVCLEEHKTEELETDVRVEIQIEKGCRKLCGKPPLPCGHSCKRECHSKTEHESVKCKEICGKKVCNKHKKICNNLCGAPCVKCLCFKNLPCGHKCLQNCHTKAAHNSVKCSVKCNKIICEEHKILCENLCGETCSVCVLHNCADCGQMSSKSPEDGGKNRCTNLVKFKNSPCGHEITVKCYEMSIKSPIYLSLRCQNACEQVKKCGHRCSGTCGECFAGKMHSECREKCDRILVCGHRCEDVCERDCPPCQKTITKSSCKHQGKVVARCSTWTLMCREKCQISCPHSSCIKECWEECDRKPCDEACLKKLPCGHNCAGFCGETCPTLCTTCDQTQNENSENFNKLVYLEDCGHSVDASVVDKVMHQEQNTFYNCPNCSSTVENCSRYRNMLLKRDFKLSNIRYQLETGSTDVLVFLPNDFTSLLSSLEAPNQKFLKVKMILEEESRQTQNYQTEQILRTKFEFYQTVLDIFRPADLAKQAQIISYVNRMLLMLQKLHLTSSNKRMLDFQSELRRVEYLFYVSEINISAQNMPAQVIKTFIVKQLEDGLPFTGEKAQKIDACLKDLQKMTNTNSTNAVHKASNDLPVPLNYENGSWKICKSNHCYFVTTKIDKCDICNK